MKRNHALVLFVIILVILNVVKWWPENDSRNDGRFKEVQAFELKINGTGDKNSHYRQVRNLFAYRKETPVVAETKQVLPKKSKKDRGLSGIKLIGVVYKDNHYQAYLLDGEERIWVKNHQQIAGHYKVTRINIKSIKLKDVNTGLAREIDLSDM